MSKPVIKKPEILSDEEMIIVEQKANAKVPDDAPRFAQTLIETIMDDIAQAQNDYCCKYYEAIIKDLEETIARLKKET